MKRTKQRRNWPYLLYYPSRTGRAEGSRVAVRPIAVRPKDKDGPRGQQKVAVRPKDKDGPRFELGICRSAVGRLTTWPPIQYDNRRWLSKVLE